MIINRDTLKELGYNTRAITRAAREGRLELDKDNTTIDITKEINIKFFMTMRGSKKNTKLHKDIVDLINKKAVNKINDKAREVRSNTNIAVLDKVNDKAKIDLIANIKRTTTLLNHDYQMFSKVNELNGMLIEDAILKVKKDKDKLGYISDDNVMNALNNIVGYHKSRDKNTIRLLSKEKILLEYNVALLKYIEEYPEDNEVIERVIKCLFR